MKDIPGKLLAPGMVALRILRRRIVTPTDCWEWPHTDRKGYGQMYVGARPNGHMVKAHRASYETFVAARKAST